ncbi:EamA family transporter [Spirosoma sp. HMF4905]|uniref:EamA family transporter n=1 Tax=Spirosoma arboris TaxID=2682092 RepID=A0A7K1SKZ0_9BACT|nr:DMT family transporter [Spirosoma arboris]MVM34434.1 EamA family transporter [Spirosoma arboris]
MTIEEPVVIPQKRPLLAWALLCSLALVWGSSFILIKRSLVAFPPEQVAAGRLVFALFFFTPFLARQSRQADVRVAVRHRWVALLASGVVGFVIPAFLFAEAGAHLNSSLAGALNSLSPLFTLILGGIFFGQSLKIRQVAGILLGLAGSLLLVFFSATGSFQINEYALLVVLATICYGLNTNLIGRYLSHLPALVSTAWLFAFAGPIALLTLMPTDFLSRVINGENSWSVGALVTLGVFGSGLMSIFFNRVMQLSSPLFAASVTYLIPIVALLWGFLDGETIYMVQFAGMGVCLAGIWLVNKS